MRMACDMGRRAVALVLGAGILTTGCGVVNVVLGGIDPACQAHHDPRDCQAALDEAVANGGLNPATQVITVAPITCEAGRCTTWVNAVPDGDDDCLPSYDVEMVREQDGSWSVGMATHGDPPCAFDP